MRPPRYHILSQERIPAPTAGMDTASADTYVAANRSRSNINFLPGRAGKLPIRGPVAWFKNLSGVITLNSNPARAANAVGWVFDNKVLVGNAPTYAVIDFSTPSAPTASASFPLVGNLQTLGYWGDGVSQLDAADGTNVRLGNYVFGPTMDNAGAAAGLARWDGGSAAANFAEMTNGPKGARSVAVWLNRLFVLSGTVPGTSSPYYKNRLYWSDPSWDGTNTLAAWQDDVTGLVNQIVLDNSHDTPVAIRVLNRSLVILRSRSIDVVTGSSPANFSVRTVAKIGCSAPNSIVVHDTGIYFLSDHGYMVYDGGSVYAVSSQIEDSAFAGLRGNILQHAFTSAGVLDAQHLILSGPGLTAVMHIPTKSWVKIALDGIDDTYSGYVGQTTDHPFVITNKTGSQRVCLLDYFTAPDLALANGVTFSDFGSVPYGGSVESRILELASPESKASLHRLLADSKPLGTTGFTVTVEALDGTVLKTLSIPSSTSNWVQRNVMDLDGIEADYVRVKWSLTSTTGPAEIQDVGVEFQMAQARTG